MDQLSRVRRLWENLLGVGAYPGETDSQRAKRRIIVGLLWAVLPFLAVTTVGFYTEGKSWLGALFLVSTADVIVTFVLLWLRPRWFPWIVSAQFLLILVEPLIETTLQGGIREAGVTIVFGLLPVLGALIVFGAKTAAWWFAGFLVTLVAAVILPESIEPLYGPVGSAETAANLATIGLLVFAVMAYFIRHRDRFQQQSDDLLANILPDEIAARLKADESMIADDFEQASVLFADVVDFTPMSAGMTPVELVTLLNDLFSRFDDWVDELGLEKIKTMGDEYMVASGVPVPTGDHAIRAAELALRMRDHVAARQFAGHTISLRIGISSGPVVAGIIGSRKFAFDLWGDTVNTASRMESSGPPGSIQVSTPTYEAVRNDFECRPRGRVDIKGKGPMETYLLVGRIAT